MSAGIAVLALIVTVVMINVKREDLAGINPMQAGADTAGVRTAYWLPPGCGLDRVGSRGERGTHPVRVSGRAGVATAVPRLGAWHQPPTQRSTKFLNRARGRASSLTPTPPGRVLVAPIWYIVEDGDLIFNTAPDTIKGKFLAREHQATICVDLEEPPYAFVQVQGNAELSNDPSELLRTATAIAARYLGPDRAEAFGAAQRGAG